MFDPPIICSLQSKKQTIQLNFKENSIQLLEYVIPPPPPTPPPEPKILIYGVSHCYAGVNPFHVTFEWVTQPEYRRHEGRSQAESKGPKPA